MSEQHGNDQSQVIAETLKADSSATPQSDLRSSYSPNDLALWTRQLGQEESCQLAAPPSNGSANSNV